MNGWIDKGLICPNCKEPMKKYQRKCRKCGKFSHKNFKSGRVMS